MTSVTVDAMDKTSRIVAVVVWSDTDANRMLFSSWHHEFDGTEREWWRGEVGDVDMRGPLDEK